MAPNLPQKISKMDLTQPMSCKYLNEAAHDPLHKYQETISNSWQMFTILPLEFSFPPNWPKRDIVQPLSCSTQGDIT